MDGLPLSVLSSNPHSCAFPPYLSHPQPVPRLLGRLTAAVSTHFGSWELRRLAPVLGEHRELRSGKVSRACWLSGANQSYVHKQS